MLEIVRLLARKGDSSTEAADQATLCLARDRLQNALHVLERTLQTVDSTGSEQPRTDLNRS